MGDVGTFTNDALASIIANLVHWWKPLYLLALLIGLSLIIKGLFQLGKSGKDPQGTRGYFFVILAGLLLLNTYSVLNGISFTVFQEASTTGLEGYSSVIRSSTSDRFHLYLTISYMLTVLVGFYGYITGATLLAKSSHNPDNLGKGIVHIMGGVLAVNIDKLVYGFALMVGGTFLSTVENVLK